MNPFLMAYANSYDNGQKLYEDIPTTYQGVPEPDNSGFTIGGQVSTPVPTVQSTPVSSVRPVGTTHPVSGMVTLDTTGQDYNNQLQNYYRAYFGGASPDIGLLNSWYGSEYTPPVTGYQKPNSTVTSGSQAQGSTSNTDNRNTGSTPNFTIGGSLLGVGNMTDAINDQAIATFNKYVALGLTPAVAAALINKTLATNETLDAVNASEDPIGLLNAIQGWTETGDSGSGTDWGGGNNWSGGYDGGKTYGW